MVELDRTHLLPGTHFKNLYLYAVKATIAQLSKYGKGFLKVTMTN